MQGKIVTADQAASVTRADLDAIPARVERLPPASVPWLKAPSKILGGSLEDHASEGCVDGSLAASDG